MTTVRWRFRKICGLLRIYELYGRVGSLEWHNVTNRIPSLKVWMSKDCFQIVDMAVWRIIFVWIIFWMIVLEDCLDDCLEDCLDDCLDNCLEDDLEIFWTIVWTIASMLRQLFGKVWPWTLWSLKAVLNPASYIIKVDLILFYFQFKRAKKKCSISFLVIDCTTIGFSLWKCTVGIFQIRIQIKN